MVRTRLRLREVDNLHRAVAQGGNEELLSFEIDTEVVDSTPRHPAAMRCCLDEFQRSGILPVKGRHGHRKHRKDKVQFFIAGPVITLRSSRLIDCRTQPLSQL
jgi:hypothetical protein